MFIVDPAGKPERFTTKVAVAAVMLPAASFVVTRVIVVLPETVDSALATGGTSLAGDNVAVNVGLVGVVGAIEELPQPATQNPRAIVRMDRRFIVVTLFLIKRIF